MDENLQVETQAEQTLSEQDVAVSEDEQAQQMLLTLTEKYPAIEVEALLTQPSFQLFIKGKKGDFLEVFDDYVRYVDDVKRTTHQKVSENIQRSTNSGHFKGASKGEEYGLTDRQKLLANKSSMSFEQYYNYLKRIQ